MINTYAQFKISGEFRTRGEINNGLKNIPDSNDITGLYVSQRTRIKFSYKNEKYETKISIQDVRAWGSENISSMTGVWGNSAGIDVHEAWVDLKLWNHSNRYGVSSPPLCGEFINLFLSDTPLLCGGVVHFKNRTTRIKI